MAITAAQWKRAVLPVFSDPAGWAFRNKLAYRQPVGWVLLGVLGEGSGWHRDQLYVWSLVMPLYIHAEHLVLSYSRRVAPSGTFGMSDQDALAAAIASAVADLPSEDAALRRIAAGSSEAAAGARVLMQETEESDAQRAALMTVRDKTAAALGVA